MRSLRNTYTAFRAKERNAPEFRGCLVYSSAKGWVCTTKWSPAAQAIPPVIFLKHDMQPDEETLTPLAYDAQHNCFGCGELNEIGMRLRFFTNQQQEVICHFSVPVRFQGPHGFAHGGVIASVLDEAMSKAIHASPHAAGLMAMTRHMETNYLRPLPLEAPMVLRAHQARVDGRKHFCEATLSDESGKLLATGKALFIAITRQPDHKH